VVTFLEISAVSAMLTEAPIIATVHSTPIANPCVSEEKSLEIIIVAIGIAEFDATEFNKTAGIAHFQYGQAWFNVAIMSGERLESTIAVTRIWVASTRDKKCPASRLLSAPAIGIGRYRQEDCRTESPCALWNTKIISCEVEAEDA
jgi:hypothetical protein